MAKIPQQAFDTKRAVSLQRGGSEGSLSIRMTLPVIVFDCSLTQGSSMTLNTVSPFQKFWRQSRLGVIMNAYLRLGTIFFGSLVDRNATFH